MQKVLHIYTTPFVNGKVIMFYNVSENLLQFSKNKADSKYAEDDFGIYSNRKYSFQLSYDERVMDVRWFNFKYTDSNKAKAVIASNQRIYIVDKNLSVLQNFSLMQHQSRLKLRNLTVVDQTILFSTDTHLHYLTQEKGSNSESGSISPSGIVMSFRPFEIGSLVGALSDRILIAYSDPSQKTNVRFSIKAVSMLEPLLLGYLSTVSQSKL